MVNIMFTALLSSMYNYFFMIVGLGALLELMGFRVKWRIVPIILLVVYSAIYIYSVALVLIQGSPENGYNSTIHIKSIGFLLLLIFLGVRKYLRRP